MRPVTAALIQMCAGPDAQSSLPQALRLTEQALASDAQLVLLPEGYAGLRPPGATSSPVSWAASAEEPEEGPAVAPFLELTRRFPGLVILGGSPELAGAGRCFNTAFVLHDGKLISRYRKIHLFDVDLPSVQLRESDSTAAGREIVVCETSLGRIGLSICYDLRFPELYRELANRSAEIIVAPSAFTANTGAAHWHLLCRTRALENQCFLLAAAQVGRHGVESPRHSYGHTLAVDPWGEVIAEQDEGEGIVWAKLDPSRLQSVRSALPALRHRVLG